MLTLLRAKGRENKRRDKKKRGERRNVKRKGDYK
jgi:hypothetical protein